MSGSALLVLHTVSPCSLSQGNLGSSLMLENGRNAFVSWTGSWRGSSFQAAPLNCADRGTPHLDFWAGKPCLRPLVPPDPRLSPFSIPTRGLEKELDAREAVEAV